MKETKESKLFEEKIVPLYCDVYKYLLHFGCNQTLSKDIAQISMEKAWINRNKLLSVDYKKQWLFRVAYNEYITQLRIMSKQYQYSEHDLDLKANEIDSITDSVANLLIKQEDNELLKQAMNLLEFKYSDPIRLRYFGELSHKEISDVLGINYNTVRSIIARGLKKLRDIINEIDE